MVAQWPYRYRQPRYGTTEWTRSAEGGKKLLGRPAHGDRRGVSRPEGDRRLTNSRGPCGSLPSVGCDKTVQEGQAHRRGTVGWIPGERTEPWDVYRTL